MKSPQDLAAGVFLIAVGLVGFAGSLKLTFGTLSAMGPGLMPRSLSVLVMLFGAALVASAFLSAGEALGRWRLRGPFFVLGAALLFGWTIRPLGLIVAGPLAVIFSSLADRQSRPIEVLVFAAVMTAFCILLFSYLLRLPIPILPTALPYPVNLLLR